MREFIDLIPGARIREIPGDSVLLALDVERIADIFEEFVTGAEPATPTSRILATVLFTDLVDSTRRAARVGTEPGRASSTVTSPQHAPPSRATAARRSRRPATGRWPFSPGLAKGVRCAARIISDARDLGLNIRTGLHTGEVERTSDDVAGLAVHLAARIVSLAKAGEILASRTVRDLVMGSDLRFTDRGEYELKGIPGRWQLFATNTENDPSA